MKNSYKATLGGIMTVVQEILTALTELDCGVNDKLPI